MVSSELEAAGARLLRRSKYGRRAMLFGTAIALCGLVLCVIAMVSVSSASTEEETELTELPDGKSYMMNMLRDRVRALRGTGEDRVDHVMNHHQDKMINKLYGKLDAEAPHESLSTRFQQAAAGVGAYNLPALDVPVSQNHGVGLQGIDTSDDDLVKPDPKLMAPLPGMDDDDTTSRSAGLSEVPHVRRAAQLESDHAFKLFQQQQGGNILLQTGAQTAYVPTQQQQRQILNQMPPVAPPPQAGAPPVQYQQQPPPQQQQQPVQYAPQMYAPAAQTQYSPPPPYQQQQQQPYQAPPPYQQQQVAAAPPPQASMDQSDTGLLAPSFVSPPTPDVPIEVGCGGISFQVQALGLHSSDSVSIEMIGGGPMGGAITQQMNGNPATATFSWTPSREEYRTLQYQICFLAVDSHRLTRSKCIALDLNPQCAASAPLQAPYMQPAVPYNAPQMQGPPMQQQQGGYAPAPYGQQPQQQPMYNGAPAPQYGAAPPMQQQNYAPQPYGQQPMYNNQYPPQQQGPPPPQYAPNPANMPALHADCAPLFMYLNTDLNDHFYTTNFKELLGGKLHYKFEGVMTGVYAVQHSGMLPVYRYFNDKTLTHVYTLDYNEWGKGTDIKTPEGDRGHTYEGVGFYLYKQPRAGLKPVYMWLDNKKNTMFSTTKTNAGPKAKGFKNYGIIGYGGCSPK